MNSRIIGAVALALTVLVAGSVAQASILVLKEGTALTTGGGLDGAFAGVTAGDVLQVAVDDTAMHVNAASTTNFGTYTTSPGSYAALLFKFDLSSLAGATIHKAQLRLYAGNGNSAENIARVTTHAWTEALATRQSWNGQTSPNWGTTSNAVFGADDIGTASPVDYLVIGAGFTVEDVTADVQAFVNGTLNNYGWALVSTSLSTSSNRTYLMSENDNEGVRPALFISYTAVPEPATLLLVALGGLAMWRRGRR